MWHRHSYKYLYDTRIWRASYPDVKDLFSSKEIENIFDNTDFVLMLNQASGVSPPERSKQEMFWEPWTERPNPTSSKLALSD